MLFRMFFLLFFPAACICFEMFHVMFYTSKETVSFRFFVCVCMYVTASGLRALDSQYIPSLKKYCTFRVFSFCVQVRVVELRLEINGTLRRYSIM